MATMNAAIYYPSLFPIERIFFSFCESMVWDINKSNIGSIKFESSLFIYLIGEKEGKWKKWQQ